MMVQSAIPLVLITTPVSLILLLAYIHKDTDSLDLSIWAFQHMHLKPLQGIVSLLQGATLLTSTDVLHC